MKPDSLTDLALRTPWERPTRVSEPKNRRLLTSAAVDAAMAVHSDDAQLV
jgi:hypothetical protein